MQIVIIALVILAGVMLVNPDVILGERPTNEYMKTLKDNAMMIGAGCALIAGYLYYSAQDKNLPQSSNLSSTVDTTSSPSAPSYEQATSDLINTQSQ